MRVSLYDQRTADLRSKLLASGGRHCRGRQVESLVSFFRILGDKFSLTGKMIITLLFGTVFDSILKGVIVC